MIEGAFLNKGFSLLGCVLITLYCYYFATAHPLITWSMAKDEPFEFTIDRCVLFCNESCIAQYVCT